jgi:hypothetical protein
MAAASISSSSLLLIFGGAVAGVLASAIDIKSKRVQWGDFLKGVLVLPIVIMPLISFVTPETSLLSAAVIAFWFGYTLRALLAVGKNRAEQQAIQKVERAEAAVETAPEKTRPLWELSSARLELYFQRNLSQIRSVFWITVMVLLAGFGLISYGVSRAFSGAPIQAATLTTASGIITEFIAATFLVVYKSTLTQGSAFVEALERINAVGMALQIAESIPETEGLLKYQAKATLSAKLLDVFVRPQSNTDKKPS